MVTNQGKPAGNILLVCGSILPKEANATLSPSYIILVLLVASSSCVSTNAIGEFASSLRGAQIFSDLCQCPKSNSQLQLGGVDKRKGLKD